MKIDNDITNKEWEQLYIPYNNNLDNFMTKYIIPEVFAFQLASSYFRDCLCNATIEQHYNSMLDIILIRTSLKNIKSATIDILQIKYNLKIANENPLILEKWE